MTMSQAFSSAIFDQPVLVSLGIWNASDATTLNTYYFVLRSGQRWYIGDSMADVSARQEVMAAAIAVLFGENWKRLYATLKPPDYDPLTNYSLSEELTGTDSDIRTPEITKKDTGTLSQAGTDTRTPNLTRKSSGTVSDDGSATGIDQNNVWGFNSTTSVPSDMSDRSATANNTNTRDITDTETGAEKKDRSSTDTYDLSHTESGTDTRNGTEHHLLTRKGNIGTNTFQNLISQERDLWKWNFYEQVFKDVDSVLTLPIY